MSLALNEIMEAWTEEACSKRRSVSLEYRVDNNALYLKTKTPGLFIGFRETLMNKYQGVLRANGYPDKVIIADIPAK